MSLQSNISNICLLSGMENQLSLGSVMDWGNICKSGRGEASLLDDNTHFSGINQTQLVNAHFIVDFANDKGNIMKMYDSLGMPSKDL